MSLSRPCRRQRVAELRRLAALVFTPPLIMALFVWPHAAGAASISSRILIDPAGENDGDTFGCSVASVGDVNGDGYDDLVRIRLSRSNERNPHHGWAA